MREIKFRFGFKVGNSIIFIHMTLDELLDCDNAHESMNLSINERLSIEGDEDIQEFDLISKDEFTGLQDKNGVDIYEGDIDEKGFVFTFVVDMGGWYRMKNGEGLQWHCQALRKGRLPFEVRGNIHQTPELLNHG